MPSEDSSIQIRSVQGYLDERGISEEALTIASNQDKKTTKTGDYLADKNVDRDAIREREFQKEGEHRRTSRSIVLWTVLPMSAVLVTWLMILITLSGFGKVKFSERFLWGILGAGTLDFLGLCYVITSDLFPKGNPLTKKGYKTEEEQE